MSNNFMEITDKSVQADVCGDQEICKKLLELDLNQIHYKSSSDIEIPTNSTSTSTITEEDNVSEAGNNENHESSVEFPERPKAQILVREFAVLEQKVTHENHRLRSLLQMHDIPEETVVDVPGTSNEEILLWMQKAQALLIINKEYEEKFERQNELLHSLNNQLKEKRALDLDSKWESPLTVSKAGAILQEVIDNMEAVRMQIGKCIESVELIDKDVEIPEPNTN